MYNQVWDSIYGEVSFLSKFAMFLYNKRSMDYHIYNDSLTVYFTIENWTPKSLCLGIVYISHDQLF